MSTVEKVNILDCTLRDGSYAVDFKFTEQDTAGLAHALATLGFDYIEVAHGVGLGASRAGKGKAPWTDERVISVAKSVVGDAKIGAFCIPGIATLDDLRSAREAGLDFVRVGFDAPTVEKAFPFLEEARRLGLFPCLNFMKSYGIAPEVFAGKAAAARDAGAEVIYLVDSAGCMTPEDIARYFEATRDACGDVKMGFHAHNNLHLAVANCLQAYRSGATFLDGTLFGLGRSAGNAPTEVLVALFERMGVPTGADLFEVMDVADAYMTPLMMHVQMHDMMAVTAGYSRFHSSFLPQVAEIAHRYGVELRRLVAATGIADAVNLDVDRVEQAAVSMARRKSPEIATPLLSFSEPGLSGDRINASLQGVERLIAGLVATAAKRQGKALLELVPAEMPGEDLVVSEFLIDDAEAVLGRVTFGSLEILDSVLEFSLPHIFLYALNNEGGAWAGDIASHLREKIGAGRFVTIRGSELVAAYVLDVIRLAADRVEDNSLAIYGQDTLIRELLPRLAEEFKTVYTYPVSRDAAMRHENVIVLDSPSALQQLGLRVGVALCCTAPDEEGALALGRFLSPEGRLIAWPGAVNSGIRQTAGDRLFPLTFAEAYRGGLRRWLGIARLFQDYAGID